MRTVIRYCDFQTFHSFSHSLTNIWLILYTQCTFSLLLPSFAFFSVTDTPVAAYIRCTGGTARGWCASHLHLLLFLLLLLLLQHSSPQPAHTHCDADSPPGRPLCSPSISITSFVRLSAFSWRSALTARWTSGCYGSSQQ